MADDDNDKIEVPVSDSDADSTDIDGTATEPDDLDLQTPINLNDDKEDKSSGATNLLDDDPSNINIDQLVAEAEKKQSAGQGLDDDPTNDQLVDELDGPSKRRSHKHSFSLPKLFKRDGSHKIKLPGILMAAALVVLLLGVFIFVLTSGNNKKTAAPQSNTKTTLSSQPVAKKSTGKLAPDTNEGNQIIKAPTDDQQAHIYSTNSLADRYRTFNDAMNKKENLNVFYHNAVLRYVQNKTNLQQFQQELAPVKQEIASLRGSLPREYKTMDPTVYTDVDNALGSLLASVSQVNNMSPEDALNTYNANTQTQSAANSRFTTDMTTGMQQHHVKFTARTNASGGSDLQITGQN